MTNIQKNKNIYKIIVLILAVLSYGIYLIFINININKDFNYNIIIFLLNWFGIILYFYTIITWKEIQGEYFSLYTIFISFLFLFTYGQCFMWAIGIHIEGEIGTDLMYYKFDIPTQKDILTAQAFTLISIIMFHFGAILSVRYKRKYNYIYKENLGELKIIYYTCLILSIIIIPYILYSSFKDLSIAMIYGYKSLYYGDQIDYGASVMGLLSRMFFPCLVGLLIGSKYDKKVQRAVYLIFSFYLIINLLSGDRGSWIFRIFILAFLSHKFYKRFNIKKILLYLIFSIFALYVVQIIVEFRDIGLSNIDTSQIIKILSLKNSPIISSVFEMGSSMTPTIMLQKYGWEIWPYSNTYILSLLGMITNKLIYILGLKFELLSSWFSQIYLGITWGAGFSMPAEALLNFGPIIAPIIMSIEGYIITSLININKNVDYKNKPLKVLFSVATLDNFIRLTRNESHTVIKDWFYGAVILCVFILILEKIFIRKNYVRNKI
ncbi:O-antigen polysaccharide polymerase Wzy [Clostridium perfringens]|nr:O-antigen polysaccharide polymerase Wzy [Clostridium perfringens]MDT9337253.1 O-antigen polysaccharide polymerase Wzy [Clostridium perfringens]MDT9345009.1 O-antigen polysaccharide polymerase Wzy [Clostridium perfringens]MDT9348247.1 O-antigen polysaccharide polymerase Wzy [Clostridium perfringens]MDT9354096.1 O-antigen polysaccharide polymerase Wzy [Clostridium perfringens]